jgi:SAM-dependent methyltransferase
MSNLYTSLAEVYDAMYQTFINYEEEYNFYSGILLRYQCKSVLEIGCGSGNLAGSFAKNQFNYIGSDLSDDMLSIAKKKNPGVCFVREDMRRLDLQEKVDSCIITGRTISYLITNSEVYDTFFAIYKNLHPGGIVCFDFIDADKFIPSVDPDKKITHTANFKNKKYKRDSYWSVNKIHSGVLDWASVYYEENKTGELLKIGEDNSTIRTFTREEIPILLKMTGFQIKEIFARPSYAFDTFVVVACKNN